MRRLALLVAALVLVGCAAPASPTHMADRERKTVKTASFGGPAPEEIDNGMSLDRRVHISFCSS